MRTFLFTAVVCSVATAGYLLAPTRAADPAATKPRPFPCNPHRTGSSRMNGVRFYQLLRLERRTGRVFAEQHRLAALRLLPDNPYSKGGRLHQNGLVSMETPVVTFTPTRK